jgi:hypothetical protein
MFTTLYPLDTLVLSLVSGLVKYLFSSLTVRPVVVNLIDFDRSPIELEDLVKIMYLTAFDNYLLAVFRAADASLLSTLIRKIIVPMEVGISSDPVPWTLNTFGLSLLYWSH